MLCIVAFALYNPHHFLNFQIHYATFCCYDCGRHLSKQVSGHLSFHSTFRSVVFENTFKKCIEGGNQCCEGIVCGISWKVYVLKMLQYQNGVSAWILYSDTLTNYIWGDPNHQHTPHGALKKAARWRKGERNFYEGVRRGENCRRRRDPSRLVGLSKESWRDRERFGGQNTGKVGGYY